MCRYGPGQQIDIRLSSRPDVERDISPTIRWESSDAPAAIAYKGEVRIDSLAADPLGAGFRSPHNLTASDDGHYLFSSASGGIYAFMRDSQTGEIALAWRGLPPSDRNTSVARSLQRAHLWWNAGAGRVLALTQVAVHGFALPEAGSTSMSYSEIVVREGDLGVLDTWDSVASSPDGQYLYIANHREKQLHGYRVDSATQLTRVQTVAPEHVAAGADTLIVAEMGLPADMTLSSDGSVLYMLTEQALYVFSRDSSSGTLALVRELPSDGTPDGPFQDLIELTNVSLDGTGTLLFVAGTHRGEQRVRRRVRGPGHFDGTDESGPSGHADEVPLRERRRSRIPVEPPAKSCLAPRFRWVQPSGAACRPPGRGRTLHRWLRSRRLELRAKRARGLGLRRGRQERSIRQQSPRSIRRTHSSRPTANRTKPGRRPYISCSQFGGLGEFRQHSHLRACGRHDAGSG